MSIKIRKGKKGVELLIGGIIYNASRAAENAAAKGYLTQGEISSELYATVPTDRVNLYAMGGVSGIAVIERQAVDAFQLITRDWQVITRDWSDSFFAAIGGIESLKKANADEDADDGSAVAEALAAFHAEVAERETAAAAKAADLAAAKAAIMALAKRPIPKGGWNARVDALVELGAKLGLNKSETLSMAKI